MTATAVPPPVTPEEAAFDAIMKQVNPTLGEMRKGVEASDAAIVKTQGTKLRDLLAYCDGVTADAAEDVTLIEIPAAINIVATYPIASTRFVLPCPLRPMNAVTPGPSATSTSA